MQVDVLLEDFLLSERPSFTPDIVREEGAEKGAEG